MASKELKDIWHGIKNALFTNPEVEKIAEVRLDICNTCPSKVEDKDSEIFNTCNECGCLLQLKSRSMESKCPLGKWENGK